jgi:capsular polysaccharide transport system permease protein
MRETLIRLLTQARDLALLLIERRRRWVYLVGVPFAVLFVYFALWASSGYLSRTQLIVEGDSPPLPNLDVGLFSLGGTTSKADALLLYEFVRSRTMLATLQQRLDLRAHYGSWGIDFFSRLHGDTDEALYQYYVNHLDVRVDDDSAVVSVTVLGYEPVFARSLATQIVKVSDEFLNGISHQIARERLDFVQSEITSAHARLEKATSDLIAMQKENEMLSPLAETESSAHIIAQLQASQAELRTQYKALTSYLNPGAPDVVAVQKKISAVEQQIEQERSKQVGGSKEGLNDLVAKYQTAQLEVTLATDIYQAALKTLEATRVDSSRKAKHLVSVSAPSLPDRAEEPQKVKRLFTAFLLLNLAYFVFTLLVAAINDHKD